jgi:hypothetical protein
MARAQLDHIILLLTDLSSVPKVLTEHFKILPGGKHADGITENLLIPLSTGEYLELVAFQDGVSDQDRHKHWWGMKTEGTIIDWCLADTPRSELIGDVYAEPKKGGRINKLENGEANELKWEVTFPNTNPYGQGEIPFWCRDITKREWRVPKSPVHPSGILGIAQVVVAVVSDTEISKVSKLIDDAFDTTSAGSLGVEERAGYPGEYLVALGPKMLKTSQVAQRPLKSQVLLRLARDEWEQTIASSNGSAAIVELVFWVDRETILPPVESQVGEGRLKFSFIKV